MIIYHQTIHNKYGYNYDFDFDRLSKNISNSYMYNCTHSAVD